MRLAPLLSYGALVWVAAVIAAPVLMASHSSAPVIAGVVVYRAASVVCHQIPERSFQLAGFPLAVCARCLGLYIGAAIASVVMTLSGQSRRGRSILALRGSAGSDNSATTPGQASRVPALIAVAALPTAATWLAERAGFWPGTNDVRFLGAVPLGFTAAWVVLAALRAERAKAGVTG